MSLSSSARCDFKRRPRRELRGRAAAGFTLIELTIVIGIVALLLAIAVPAYKDTIQRNRVQAEANSFVADVQFARAEAIKRGSVVSICPSSTGNTCSSTTTNWAIGWLVFVDNGNDGVYTVASDQLLRVRAGWTGGDTFAPSATTAAFKFSGDGFATGLTGTVTMKLHTTPTNNNATRCVALNLAGHQTVLAYTGTATCN